MVNYQDMSVYTDFSEYAIGSFPEDWERIIGTGAGQWEVVTPESWSLAGNLFRWAPSGDSWDWIAWTKIGTAKDQEVLARIRWTSNLQIGVMVRGLDGVGAYAGRLHPNSNGLTIHKRSATATSDTLLKSQSYSASTPFTNWVRMTVEGNIITLKTWRDGQDESTSSQIQVTDNTYTEGYAGVSMWSTGSGTAQTNRQWDIVGFQGDFAFIEPLNPEFSEFSTGKYGAGGIQFQGEMSPASAVEVHMLDSYDNTLAVQTLNQNSMNMAVPFFYHPDYRWRIYAGNLGDTVSTMGGVTTDNFSFDIEAWQEIYKFPDPFSWYRADQVVFGGIEDVMTNGFGDAEGSTFTVHQGVNERDYMRPAGTSKEIDIFPKNNLADNVFSSKGAAIGLIIGDNEFEYITTDLGNTLNTERITTYISRSGLNYNQIGITGNNYLLSPEWSGTAPTSPLHLIIITVDKDEGLRIYLDKEKVLEIPVLDTDIFFAPLGNFEQSIDDFAFYTYIGGGVDSQLYEQMFWNHWIDEAAALQVWDYVECWYYNKC